MPGPSDIRVNPFNNATNYVNLTERHIVPSVSPFVVRLNEVPEKQDPSNMQMFYVDDTTGQTTETALTEVAATPGAGEFRPDYSTNAFDDTSWNTGLIEFSSADAGKIIEVSYTATGTLAGVKTNRYPAWWLDRGDGSDGVFSPSGDVTISGEKNYTSVFIPTGVTVTVRNYAAILCLESFVNKGTITAAGQGAGGGAGSGSADTSGKAGSSGVAGTGGAGGKGRDSRIGSGAGGGAGGGRSIEGMSVTEDVAKLLCAKQLSQIGIGGGGGGGGGCHSGYSSSTNGGNGGNGGGEIRITCMDFKNDGSISANGANGAASSKNGGGGGGGGGGTVLVICNNLVTEGIITANGGNGGGGNNGGAAGAKGGEGFKLIKEMGVS